MWLIVNLSLPSDISYRADPVARWNPSTLTRNHHPEKEWYMDRHSSEVQLVDTVAYIILDVPDPHPASRGVARHLDPPSSSSYPNYICSLPSRASSLTKRNQQLPPQESRPLSPPQTTTRLHTST